MRDGLNPGWKQSGRFSGNYCDYTVQGFKFVSPTAEVGWQITSWPNARSIIHHYWVSGTTLYEFGAHPAQSILNRQPIEVLGEATNVDPEERKAILTAIRDWESPVPKWTDWQNFDPNDISTHPDNGTRIEIQLENGRIVRGIYGAGILGTVGYSNLVSEEEQNSKKRWRYSEDHP